MGCVINVKCSIGEIFKMTEERTPYEVTFEEPKKGIVVAKKCETCNHHEIGIETDTGEYFQIEIGMKATINGKIV
jgi:hypothetical protein